MAVIGIFIPNKRHTCTEINLSVMKSQPKSNYPKRARVLHVNGTKCYIRNLMVSNNIRISSVYALYSIFREEIPDFRYNIVSTPVSTCEKLA